MREAWVGRVGGWPVPAGELPLAAFVACPVRNLVEILALLCKLRHNGEETANLRKGTGRICK